MQLHSKLVIFRSGTPFPFALPLCQDPIINYQFHLGIVILVLLFLTVVVGFEPGTNNPRQQLNKQFYTCNYFHKEYWLQKILSGY